ncbi:ANTAR domain-containing protein [Streptomyces sp. NPDC003077]|uniref:ANTAR domain-containing protein n=1 Tax=Streptomyces sp. NPDC003077 TaxID=3154443 RepID=UPI0033BEE028
MVSEPMARLLRALHAGGGGAELATHCADVLGLDGVAVSLATEGGSAELVFSVGEEASRFEDLQFTLGEGPGPDAMRSGLAVFEPEWGRPGISARWPLLVPAAGDLPVRAVFCFPLSIGAIKVGVLTGVRLLPGGLSDTEWNEGRLLAETLTTLLLSRGAHVPYFPNGGSPASSKEPWVLHRAVVHQATGMVSVQLGISLAEALLRLRAYAYGADRPIGAVAEDVVARRLRLEDDGYGPGLADGGKE